jgi:signal transduction histidine kinase
LSLVKAVTQAHQGSVAVQSNSSAGSTFTVALPIAGSG